MEFKKESNEKKKIKNKTKEYKYPESVQNLWVSQS